jgi:hypothetical protein
LCAEREREREEEEEIALLSAGVQALELPDA